MSSVWQYFTLDCPTSKTATCKICNNKISRGGTNAGNYNTSNMIKHLKTRHAKEHDEMIKVKELNKNELQQQTLETAFQRREKFSKDSRKATQITDKIVEFIVLDDQPLSVVENVGFRRLMEHLEPRYCLPGRKYISETALPKLYETVKEHISSMLKDIHAVSFTTDIWSSDVCPMSLLSLTSHWVDRESTPRSAVLHAMEFRGSHTGTLIAEAIERMLAEWKIPKSHVHVVLRDNASNMKKAMDEMDVPSLGCFAHTLQLVVHEGLLSQRSVSDALANARKIIAHFKHSPLATTRLEDLQKDFQMPIKRLHQDVSTRWNSTYYMVESILEQKRTISAYGADHDLPVTLTANQWALLEKTITVLAPFEELTRQMSSSTSSAAEVIPSVTVLKRLLARENEGDTGIKTMKTTLLEAVQKRFKTVESEPLYAVATLLDPRFKDRYFTSADSIKHAKDALTREVEKMEAFLNSRTASEGAEAAPGNPHKAPRMEAQPDSGSSRKSSLKGLFEEILQEHDEDRGASSTSTQVQIQSYLTEQTVPRSDSPFLYWGVNQIRFPTMAATAAKFLCAPCTSVDSERLFSAASNIVDAKRNRLGGERAEMLIFLKKNLPLLLKL